EVLADVADRQRRGADDLAAVGLLLVQQELEKRRLPGAVAAHEHDFLAGIVLPGHASQHVVRAVGLLDVVEAIEHAAALNGEGRKTVPRCGVRAPCKRAVRGADVTFLCSKTYGECRRTPQAS